MTRVCPGKFSRFSGSALSALLPVFCSYFHLCAEGLKGLPNKPPPAYRVSVNQVIVPAGVKSTRTGRFLADLSPGQFRLYEDGIEQRLTYFARGEVPLSVVLLLDTSRSTKDRLSRIQAQAQSFLKQLRPEDEVMVISFDDSVRVEVDFTNRTEEVVQAIRNIRSGGSTCLYYALNFAVQHKLSQRSGRKAIVLFSDGINWSRLSSAEETLRNIEETDVILYAVFFEAYSRQEKKWDRIPVIEQSRLSRYMQNAEEFLAKLTTISGGGVFDGSGVDSLNYAFSRIAAELRHLYILGYKTSCEKPGRSLCEIAVEVTVPDTLIRHRKAYRRPQ